MPVGIPPHRHPLCRGRRHDRGGVMAPVRPHTVRGQPLPPGQNLGPIGPVPAVRRIRTGGPWVSTAKCSVRFHPLGAGQGLVPAYGPCGLGRHWDRAGVHPPPRAVGVLLQGVWPPGSHAPVPPAGRAAMGVFPAPGVRRHIPPRDAGAQDPEDGMEAAAVVLGRATGLAGATRPQRLQALPGRVGDVRAAVDRGQSVVCLGLTLGMPHCSAL